MKNIAINAKHNLGDKVYTIFKKRIIIPCDMCSGHKMITHNNISIKCPKCKGAGEFHINKTRWVVDNTQLTVLAIKVKIVVSGRVVKYTLGYSDYTSNNYANRAEGLVFETIEEAEKACVKKNANQLDYKITDIKITKAFSNNIPASDKIAKRIEEYKSCGKFNTAITVNSDGYLTDGYSAYLVCKMLDFDTIKIVVE